jgi:hypothetical protein
MPIDNLAKIHFSEEENLTIHQGLDQILETLTGLTINLTAAERRKYGKVGEQNKLLINKVRAFHQNDARLESPEIDWAEFERDYQDRVHASMMLAKIKSVEQLLLNIKILRDYDNYTDALRDYQYAKYKNRFADQIGYSSKIDALKVFFPKTGKTKKTTKDL